MVVSDLVKYWCIHHYHKCKMENIELGVMKEVLIRVYNWKKTINVALKSEMGQLFWDNFF